MPLSIGLREAALVQRLDVVRPDGKRFIEARDRGIQPPQVGLNDPPVEMGL